MEQNDRNKVLSFALELAQEAGKLVVKMRESDSLEVHRKGRIDLVTDADRAADELIASRIRAQYPDHFILSEELSPDGAERLKEGPAWIVDPIDGTTNYAHRLPHFGISLAFAIGGETQCAAVYSPMQGELFAATRDGGATLNGEPIQIRDVQSLSDTLVCTGFPYDRDNLRSIMSRAEAVLRECQDLRRIGACSIDICWVACGRMDAFYERVSPWDMAAALLIAREAGATFSQFVDENPLMEQIPPELNGANVLVASPHIIERLKCLLDTAVS